MNPRFHAVELFAYSTAFFLVVLAASSAVSSSEPNGSEEWKWKILTKQNFSSQIRLHPHILLVVTLPWSGESRSLMKELAEVVLSRKEDFSSLKLRLMYRNVEKMLADAIGASDETTILYYHHSLSYKYRGRLRAQTILSSIHPYLSFPPEDVPLKSVDSLEELGSFRESTDRAILLLEFCGWTRKLLNRMVKKNDTLDGFGLQGDYAEHGFNGTTLGKNNQKGMENENLQCGLESGFGGLPWFGELKSTTDTEMLDPLEIGVSADSSCNFKELQQFDSFFSKFMGTAREYLLPLERHRFGFVSNKSLIPSLGVGGLKSWSVILEYAGCPTCSKVFQELDDLESFIQMDSSVVTELDHSGHDGGPSLPANKPSVLLFVDRSSGLYESRMKSKEALNALRELALNYRNASQLHGRMNVKSGEFLFPLHSLSRGASTHPKINFHQSSQKANSGKKMSIMLVNDGKRISLENINSKLQGNSLQEILSNILQFKKDSKLSSLAKKVGFELLSEDLEIKLADLSPSQTEAQHVEAAIEHPQGDFVSSQIEQDSAHSLDIASSYVVEQQENVESTHLGPSQYRDDDTNTGSSFTLQNGVQNIETFAKHQLEDIVSGQIHHDSEKQTDTTSASALVNGEELNPMDLESSTCGGVKAISDDPNPHWKPVEKEQLSADSRQGNPDAIMLERTDPLEVEDMKVLQLNVQGFNGSFYFSDGDNRLLKALTGDIKIPSLVIIDPILQQHYVFPDQTNLTYALMSEFLDGYLNGSLLPYQQSEAIIPNPREAPHPPFVNLDFHETDRIPRVSARTLSELALGFNMLENKSAARVQHKDVLVLFSNSWCGFCQRMELVLREVYRAFRGYMNVLKSGFKNVEIVSTRDDLNTIASKLPLIYMIDCTLNDCHHILKLMNQSEVYPTLLLFPAESKDIIPYGGAITVTEILKFVVEKGSNSQFISEKGIFEALIDRGGATMKTFHGTSTNAAQEQGNFREILLGDTVTKRKVESGRSNSQKSEGLEQTVPEVVVGSVLVATEKLNGVHPFDKSMVLVTQSDEGTGFQGLIINKLISWDTVQEIVSTSDKLKNAPLSLGGPLIRRGSPLSALTRKALGNQYLEVLPGLYFLDQSATSKEIEEIKLDTRPPGDYWFFLGFASWGWRQLYDEIAQGAWTISHGNTELIEWPSGSV